MNFRFRFTLGFLAISIAIFAIAAVVVTQSARSNEEANLVDDISKQSTQNADLVAGTAIAFTSGTSGGNLVGAAADSAASIGFESLVMSTLVQNSNIVRLSLFDVDGSLLWSSTADSASSLTPDRSIFAGAVNGEIVTGLNKSVEFISSDGEVANGDLTSTYIPLVDNSTQRTSQVLEVAREVTDALDFRVDNARSSMFRTLFSTLGASFAVLFGVVITADTILHRSRNRAVAQEVAVAESKLVAERLELKNQHLQQINEERDRFLSMVSHELRTPLTTMLAFTEVLRRRQEGSNRDANLDHLALMRRNGDHLNELIQELLEVTQIHAEEFGIVKERFGLARLIQEIEISASLLLASKHQTMRIDGSANDAELYADRKRMTQLMMNLLSNASLYSPERTTITLDVRHQGDLAKITVTDEGGGIPEEDCKQLFDQFYRGNNEKTRAESGLGLGLSIVKAIVDAHDGKISVRSQVGKGTEITVLIPTVSDTGHLSDFAPTSSTA